MDPSVSSSNSNANDLPAAPPVLPQYGFGATYAFDVLVEHHHFLYRVHTPKHPKHASRPSSPSPAPSPRPISPFRPPLARSPSSLSASFSSIGSATSFPTLADEEDDGAAPGDPYFLSRRFKDDLGSPDAQQRRRTLSTLSTLSAGSTTYIGSEDGSDDERPGLTRSTSMMLPPSRARTRASSLAGSGRPGHARSQSADVRQPPPTSMENASLTYAELVSHLDWTTRSGSPYVTTSFSFFWCLWEAVRRYRLGIKHGVEIAVIDARKVRTRARTALEVLRGVEGDKQDKAYWKWYRFALDSQDVLVFGAIPGDAIYASIPLTQILPHLPAYFFKEDVSVPAPLADPEPEPEVDPRSPATQQQQQPVPFFPSTPSRRGSYMSRPPTPATPARIPQLLDALAWDIGTTLKKPPRKSKAASTPGRPAPRYTSHRDFCSVLAGAFLAPAPARTDAERMEDSTAGAVRLALLLVGPWFRARCAEGAPTYSFRHDEDESEDEDGSDEGGKECLGLAGDGCALEHSHVSSAPSVNDSDSDDSGEADDARHDAAAVLTELALSLARWPAAWWTTEHTTQVGRGVRAAVRAQVREAREGARDAVQGWERSRVPSLAGSVRSLAGSVRSVRSLEEDGRRGRGREESPSPSPPARWPQRGSSAGTSHRPRARSPLGLGSALGPAIVLKSRSEHLEDGARRASTPPPSGPAMRLTQSALGAAPSPFPAPSPSSSMNMDVNTNANAGALTTPPPTPPHSTARPLSPSFSARHRTSPPPPPRSQRRTTSPGTSPPASLSSSLSSLEPRPALAAADEEDVFLDWAYHGRGAAAMAALSRERSGSTESLRNAVPEPEPSPLRSRGQAQAHGDAREALLAEVVQSMLGVSMGSPAASPTPAPRPGEKLGEQDLRVDTVQAHAHARPAVHHRRHSSHGSGEAALSPVREDEDEDQGEGETGAGSLGGSLESSVSDTRDGQDVVHASHIGDDASLSLEHHGTSLPSATSQTADIETDANLPTRALERSGTLESIAEEDDWSFVDVPADDASVLKLAFSEPAPRPADLVDTTEGSSVGESERETGKRLQAADVPLPASPTLEPARLSDDAGSALPDSASREDRLQAADVPLPTSPALDPIRISDDAWYTLLDRNPAESPSVKRQASPRPRRGCDTSPAGVFGLPILDRLRTGAPAAASAAPSPIFEDVEDGGDAASTSSWTMSCFVCGVMVSLVIASVQRREAALMLHGNPFC